MYFQILINILGHFASTFLQLSLYGIGMSLPSCSIDQLIKHLFNGLSNIEEMCSWYFAAIGLFGGPVIAAIYATCSEVLLGQHVPEIYSAHLVGLGAGMIIGPTAAGKWNIIVKEKIVYL